MGQEILYCYKCQTRLLGSEFEKGKAFKVGGKAACPVCVKDLLASMPEAHGEVDQPRKVHSTTRIPAQSPDSSSKFKAATLRASAAPPPPEKSKNGLIIAAVVGAAVLVLLIAMAMGSGRNAPHYESVPQESALPAPLPGPVVRPPEDPKPGPYVPAPPTFIAELRETDEKLRAIGKDDFRRAAEFLAEARRKHSEAGWLQAIDERNPQVEARANRAASPLREKALEARARGDAAEVKRIRDLVASWGYAAVLAEFETALAAPPAPVPSPAPDPSGAAFVVYADALGPGCRDHSWDATVDFASTETVFEGVRAISFAPKKKFAGLYLGIDAKLDTATYPFVTFAVCPLEDQVSVSVTVWGDTKTTSTLLDLDKLGGAPRTREWKKYVVPVSTFTPSDVKVLAIVFQTVKVSSQPIVCVDSVAFLRSAPGAGPPAPAPHEVESYRSRWVPAAAKAALRDYAGAQRELEDAAASLKDGAAKAEAAADLEDLKLASAVASEGAAVLLKWPKYARLRAEFQDDSGARVAVEGPVMQADPLRVTILKDRDTIEIPAAELSGSTLADLFRSRPEKKPATDARAAALFCLFEGDAPAAKRHQAEGLPGKYSILPSRPPEPEAETTARKLFWSAEAEWKAVRSRGAAIQKYLALLGDHEKTAFVGRVKPLLTARIEAGRDIFLFADDMTATGTMVPGEHARVDSCWISNADSQPMRAKENSVEFEFHAQAGQTYKAWVYAGGCCLETFGFSIQGTEMTAPRPGKPGEMIAVDPGSDAAIPARAPTSSLKKFHAHHGGPKEPAKWEWFPIPLPKYATPGPKKVRLLTDQQGFGVGFALVSALRAAPPREQELKEIERSRLGVTAPAPAGSILREWWLNVQGYQVEDLTKSPAFQGKPSGSDLRTIFEAPIDWGDNYGQRFRGYVHPPVTGNYTFWVACDDTSELWLSADETPGRKRLIASQNMAGGVRDWNRTPTSKSAPIALAAGRRYYIEALHKEGNGNDHVAVGWQLPDGTDERPIPGKRLSPLAQGGKAGNLTFYRAININGAPASIDGLAYEGKGAPNFQVSGTPFEAQQVELSPPTDAARAAMIRTSVSSPAGTKALLHSVPAGVYAVYLYVWEHDQSATFDLLVNDRPVIANYQSGNAGRWEKLGPWLAAATEGRLEVRADPGAASFSGLEVWRIGK
jgi:hypothetical protein